MSSANLPDARRGTVLWGFKSWRSDALVGLMHDLVDIEASGLSENECAEVKRTLEKICNAFSAIPDRKFLRGTIWDAMTKFADAYGYWNDEYRKPGNAARAIELRKKGIRMMQNYRNLLAARQRKNQHILQNEVDLKLVNDLYGVCGELVKSMPTLFKTLGIAVEAFAKGPFPKG
jgi:hypothetical protein